MDFEEMKKVWDQQLNQPLYMINESTMHKLLRRKIRASERSVQAFEWGLLVINAFVVGFLLFRAVGSPHAWLLYLLSGISLLVSTYIFVGRINRKRANRRFDQSLLGSLDLAIENRNYLIRRGRTFVWWYLLPFAIGITFSMLTRLEPEAWWKWAVMIPFFGLAALLPGWEVRYIHEPKRRALESLRKALTDEADVLI